MAHFWVHGTCSVLRQQRNDSELTGQDQCGGAGGEVEGLMHCTSLTGLTGDRERETQDIIKKKHAFVVTCFLKSLNVTLDLRTSKCFRSEKTDLHDKKMTKICFNHRYFLDNLLSDGGSFLI